MSPAKESRGAQRQTRQPPATRASGQFGKTLVRVLAVQVVTLVLLWLLQSHFSY